jgi:hypothetical protein
MQIVVLWVASFPIAASGLLLGDVWSTTMEVIRIGNGHLGQIRGERIPWGHHLRELFGIGVALVWAIGAVRLRKLEVGNPGRGLGTIGQRATGPH